MPSYPTIESSMSGQQSYQSYQDHADKRNRTNGTNLEDEMGDDDDDDDDDDDGDDGDDRNDSGKGTPAKGKGRGGEKPKAKLTRGSRYVPNTIQLSLGVMLVVQRLTTTELAFRKQISRDSRVLASSF